MNDPFWDFYWENHLQHLQGQGKGYAIQAASSLIRTRNSLRILELGCGEGQIIGSLLQAHGDRCSIETSLGIDLDPLALQTAHRQYPSVRFIEGDFTDAVFLNSLGTFDLVLLVNALHHVFSAAYDEELGQINPVVGKKAVRQTFTEIQTCLNLGGCLLLFDGIEAPDDRQALVEFRFLHPQAKSRFLQFLNEYRSFKIQTQPGSKFDSVALTRHDFTRYVTKMIFLGKPLWQREREESYQYFNQSEFEDLFISNRLKITRLETISVDLERWQDEIEILTPGMDFPAEHILLVAENSG